MDRRIVRGIYSAVVGIAITLISGLFQTPFARILDVVRMGAPLTWMQRVVPSTLIYIDWINFAADWTFWLIIVLIVINVTIYFRHKQTKKV